MKVVQGRDEWLFLDNDSNQVNKQLTGEIVFSKNQLLQWQLLLEMRSLWLAKQKVSCFFLIAPNKACVYPEYLPEHIKIVSDRCTNQLLDYLSSNSFVKPIYPLGNLVATKSQMQTYSKRDTHWNNFGAFVAYQSLMAEISKFHDVAVLSQAEIEFVEISSPPDLGSKLGIKEDSFISANILRKCSQCVSDNKVHNRGRVIIFENQNKNLPQAVLFRDSFSGQMLKFFAESFSRLVTVWQPNIDYSIVLKEKPDIVISQQVERYLLSIPDDLKGLSNQELIDQKAREASLSNN